MEKHVAVRADFPDAPYIEQAGLWSAAMQRAHFVWCQTAAWPRRGGAAVGSTDATSRGFAFAIELMFASLGLSPQEGRRGFSPCCLCVDVYRTRQFIKNAFCIVSRQADGREMATEI